MLIGIEEDHRHSSLIHPSSGRTMELDLFIEELKLAIEYQGQQHYAPVYSIVDFGTQQQRDQEKIDACKLVPLSPKYLTVAKHGITLVVVPYWWDGTKESLAATIHKAKPQIIQIPLGALPISETPPLTSRGTKPSITRVTGERGICSHMPRIYLGWCSRLNWMVDVRKDGWN